MTYLEFVKKLAGIDLSHEAEDSISYQIDVFEFKSGFSKYLKTKPSMPDCLNGLMATGHSQRQAIIKMLFLAEDGYLEEYHVSGCKTVGFWEDYHDSPKWALRGINRADLK